MGEWFGRDFSAPLGRVADNAGFTAPIVMALGGWKSERMMRRYAAVTDQTLRRAAEAVARNEFVGPPPERASRQIETSRGAVPTAVAK